MKLKLRKNASSEVELYEMPEGTSAQELAEKLNLKDPGQALAAVINGKTLDLSTPLRDGDEVTLLGFDDPQGKEVFWHTSAHVLAQAVLRLYPNAKPTIGPPIESGFYYDFADLHISDEDFEKINKEMEKIAQENHASQKEAFQNKKEAIEHFKDNKYKVELIESFDPEAPLTGYRQGEFFDLCRGPHLPKLGKIKAIKLLKLSGAYWRGDSKNEMLTRIYAISFPDKKQLKAHLQMLEEAKKRDHKILGPKLDLFSLKEEAPGMPFIHPKGMHVWSQLIDFLRHLLDKHHYIEIKTPSMMTRSLWETSGHWANYRENMFTSVVEDRDFAIKPMNCPGCMLFYKTHSHSYRELPLRVAEIGNVHRFEPSGALSGLFRVRSFHQDDAHIFMKPSDIESEILKVLELADVIYSAFGLQYHLELSTRPESNTVGSDEEWHLATEGLRGALEKSGRPYKVNEGDGAFYGPKIDFHIKDALGRTWQCGTVQLDMSLPEKFDLEYIDQDGGRKRPVMIHRALFGSIERFFGILIEHFSGKFPMWLSPVPIRILTVADRHNAWADAVREKIKAAGLLVEVDETGESVGKKVRNAQLAQVNYMLTIGDKEVEHQTVNLRTRDNVVRGEIGVEAFLETVLKEYRDKSLTSPFT
ncbi:MAG: threonine--tRNA ligase [Chlamydiia bacterium]|nr:threonine--tRNA ligase [Chlamydiia bacterium]